MKLYSERQREQSLLEAEAMGIDVWKDAFSTASRVKLWSSLDDAVSVAEALPGGPTAADTFFQRAVQRLRYSEGVMCLGPGSWRDAKTELLQWLTRHCPSDHVPDVIEAVLNVGLVPEGPVFPVFAEGVKLLFTARVHSILQEERISFRLVDMKMVPFSSMELHQAVVEPTLLLLSGKSAFGDAETAYQDALKEVASNPDNAITDAGRALEQTLKALGCEGNSLGARLNAARKKGVIAGHDGALLESISRTFDWVSADRSERGDTHTSPTTNPHDAWLAIHIVGALIFRLAQDEPRVS